jgi:hypothetical protein
MCLRGQPKLLRTTKTQAKRKRKTSYSKRDGGDDERNAEGDERHESRG